MRSALAFLTVVGRSQAPTARTLRWFPAIGALLGAVLAVIYLGAHELWTPMAAGAIVLLADLVLTGALHFDGLTDSADGLMPHMDRERRLVVMAQPDVGAFALAAGVTILLLRWSALADPELAPLTLVAIWTASRTAAAVIPALIPYARSSGLATPFIDGASAWLALWLVPAGALLVVVSSWFGLAAICALVLAAAAVVAIARRRLGGFTGDVLGAVIVLSETAALLAVTVQR